MPLKDVCLNVLLPKNRDHPGWLRVEVEGSPQTEFRVLGRGSATVKKNGVSKPTGNHTRNPFRYAGNTPIGDYTSPEIVSTDGWEQGSYGPWGAVRLKAIGGDALVAERLGRTGLLIHGGTTGRFDGFRSTMGCLRLQNGDMRRLIQIIGEAGTDPRALQCTGVTVRVMVREF